ncbi:hypothetical protein NC651_003931 [Populus alba x Populus x berolinensis]|nr:hypothetical protein NC651_003931 [Populus alba x Populus x berolinensis]
MMTTSGAGNNNSGSNGSITKQKNVG